MVKIRLLRAGAKKRPYYRIIAIDERRKRNGRALEFLGSYDPLADPPAIRVRRERVEAWVARGAQISGAVEALLREDRRRPKDAEAQPAVSS